MLRLRSLARVCAGAFILIACASDARAQQPIELEPIVISPSRYAEPAGQVGSAVTVIGRDEIEASRAENVAQLLETVPGMTINSAGGIGGSVSASIRGAEPDQTLVMIDGVRVNDPASTGSEFDFAVLSLGNVERIEVIRGPQSGVYGSDAIGGVINIITRKGEGDPHGVAEAEGGSYKTFAQRVYAGASKDAWSMSVAASNFRSSGFSRFSGGTEDDATRMQSINGRVDYDPSPVFGLTVTAGRYELKADLDSVGLTSSKDTADTTDKILQLATATTRLNLFDGAFQNKLTAFIADSHRVFFDDNGAQSTPVLIGRTSTFDGTSRGLEYQGDLAVRSVDRLVFGGRIDQQTAQATDDDAKFGFQPRYDVEEVWRSAFALYSFNPTDVLNLTAALRADEFGPAGTEATWRLSGSYRFPELGTKLRASYGTGAKAPTIQQRFENSGFAIGNPDLGVETSRGYDIGLDQELAGGAVTLSGTYFSSDIDDLIATEFEPISGKLTFANVDSAAIDGIELAASWKAAAWVTLRGAYTHLDAVDAETGLKLQRRPDDAFNLKATVLPADGLTLTASVTYVGERFNRSGERDLLDDYVRVDLAGTYALTPDAEIFFRAENVLDAEYEEIKDFGTAGRSGYLGVRARF
jgi:vitamin B12 transporter